LVSLFPIMLNLDKKNCLVVGGGEVATRKVQDLLSCGARVKVVAPLITASISQWADQGLVEYKSRLFNTADIDGMIVVISATNNEIVNREIANQCRTRGILVNVVDDPPNCDFFIPAVVRRGALAITVGTEGKSPLLARRIKEELEAQYGEEYAQLVDLLGEARLIIKDLEPDIENRKRIFAQLVEGQLLEIIRQEGPEQAREWIHSVYSGRGTKSPDCTTGD